MDDITEEMKHNDKIIKREFYSILGKLEEQAADLVKKNTQLQEEVDALNKQKDEATIELTDKLKERDDLRALKREKSNQNKSNQSQQN